MKKQKRETLTYTIEVRDKEGRIIQRISAPSRSYVQAWNQILNIQASQANQTIKDTGGVDRGETQRATALSADAAIAYVLKGIRVGKGTTAVAIDDYNLGTPLGEGTGLDQVSHQAMSFSPPSVVVSTCSFTLKRIMINNSGAGITGIREIGCYHIQYLSNYLGFRDILGEGVDVPAGGAITVEYTIGVTA